MPRLVPIRATTTSRWTDRGGYLLVWRCDRIDVDRAGEVAERHGVEFEKVDGGFSWRYPGKPRIYFIRGAWYCEEDDARARLRQCETQAGLVSQYLTALGIADCRVVERLRVLRK